MRDVRHESRAAAGRDMKDGGTWRSNLWRGYIFRGETVYQDYSILVLLVDCESPTCSAIVYSGFD